MEVYWSGLLGHRFDCLFVSARGIEGYKQYEVLTVGGEFWDVYTI